jgi:tetratricopeptide (TPR) repeat protein
MASNKANVSAPAPNREDLLQLAIAAARRGDKDSARMMFNQILTDDKNNERALMWMAKLADNRDEMVVWLNRALAVNPNNQVAKDALAKMKTKSSARDNRVLVLFGMVAGVLFILLLIVLIVLVLPQ